MKPEFWSDEKLAPCDALTRLAFLGLISMADDAGRLLDNIKQVDAFIFPETSDTAREALAKLSGMGRILRGSTGSGQRVIQIVNWERHQRVDHPNTKASLPEIVELEVVTLIPEPLATEARGVPDQLASRSTTYDHLPANNDLRSTITDHPITPPRANETRLRELLPESCHPALRRVLNESGRGMEGAALAMCQMLDPDDGTTGPGGRPVTALELATALQQLAGMPSPGWNGGGYVRQTITRMRQAPVAVAVPGETETDRMTREVEALSAQQDRLRKVGAHVA